MRSVKLTTLVIGLLLISLTGCGSEAGLKPVVPAQGTIMGVVNSQALATWSVDLAQLGLSPRQSRGQAPYLGYTFAISLTFMGDATNPSAVVSRQVPVNEDGTATIAMAMTTGDWQVDQAVVAQAGKNLLANAGPVTFQVVAGRATVVSVALSPVK